MRSVRYPSKMVRTSVSQHEVSPPVSVGSNLVLTSLSEENLSLHLQRVGGFSPNALYTVSGFSPTNKSWLLPYNVNLLLFPATSFRDSLQQEIFTIKSSSLPWDYMHCVVRGEKYSRQWGSCKLCEIFSNANRSWLNKN
jgi:hypothetical protein